MPKFKIEDVDKRIEEIRQRRQQPTSTPMGTADRQGLLRRLLQKAKAKKGITEPL